MRKFSHQGNPSKYILAWSVAMDAHESNFASRRGLYAIAMGRGKRLRTTIAIYDNNPYACFPDMRDRETDALRTWLAQNNYAVLATADYPNEGKDAGYTQAMIVDADESAMNRIEDAWEIILAASAKEMATESELTSSNPCDGKGGTPTG